MHQAKQDQLPKLGKDIKTDHKPPAELALSKIERTLNAVVVALEILTGVCAGLEDMDTEPGTEGELFTNLIFEADT
jgi:hypothetical protein